MKTPEEINGMTPEQIKDRLRAFVENWHNPSFEVWQNGHHALVAVMTYIEQLEEKIMCMNIQMRGDCGCCKHRSGLKINAWAITMSKTCEECIMQESRPNWEYEGLPELPKKGESA